MTPEHVIIHANQLKHISANFPSFPQPYSFALRQILFQYGGFLLSGHVLSSRLCIEALSARTKGSGFLPLHCCFIIQVGLNNLSTQSKSYEVSDGPLVSPDPYYLSLLSCEGSLPAELGNDVACQCLLADKYDGSRIGDFSRSRDANRTMTTRTKKDCRTTDVQT